QYKITGYNLGHVALMIRLLVSPGAGLRPALTPNLACFFRVFSATLLIPLPLNYVLLYEAVIRLALFVFLVAVVLMYDLLPPPSSLLSQSHELSHSLISASMSLHTARVSALLYSP